ncbi:MAG TPA: nucleotide exchange factor GrpE [Nitrospinota bacterium]|nr:nucleotide exchange factor GrpE [Nitrospinota bacterium]
MEDKKERRNIKEENNKSQFSVSDKRFWAKKREGEEEAKEPVEKHPTFVEQLKTELENKDKKLREYIDSFKKMQKENDNFRNRLEKDSIKSVEREKSKFIAKFLEIMDNLDRAVDSAKKTGDINSLIEGIKMIHNQFSNFLKTEGVEPIETIGKEFDPNVGEAVEVLSVSNKKDDNVVLEEIQKGYKMNDLLIRPAKVRVGKLIQKTSKEDQ